MSFLHSSSCELTNVLRLLVFLTSKSWPVRFQYYTQAAIR